MGIEYMDGSKLLEVITTTNPQVAGTSAVDTARQLAAQSYRLNSGESGIVNFPFTVIKGGTPITLEALYASQMWDYFKITSSAAISSIGTAAAAATSWAQGVLFGDPALAGTLAGSGGLLTMPLPVAATVMTPLLGVSLGGTLYELNPELWTKISQTLLPFAYDDKDTIAFVVDALGQVFAPKDAVESLSQLLQEEGIGGEQGKTSELPTGWDKPVKPAGKVVLDWGHGLTKTISYYGNSAVSLSGSRQEYVVASASPGNIVYAVETISGYSPSYRSANTIYEYTNDGKTVYWVKGTTIESGSPVIGSSGINTPLGDISFSEAAGVAWTLIYGNSVGEYPEGTSEWGGDSVDISQLEPVLVISSMNGDTKPYIPVTLPVGDPTVTNDPAIQPNPIAPVTAPQLDPYISPTTSPEMWPEEIPYVSPGESVGPQVESDPLYVPQPDLNPNANPSILPDIEPAGELPTNQNTPESGGSSPDPSFPVPSIPFPSWVPAGSDTPVPSGQPGFIQVYHPNYANFINFGRWLWVTYADSTIDKIWNNPFDGVIGAHELYATPADGGYSTIRCGFLDSGIETQLVRQRYTQINCGSMVIPEYWGNYLDYSPYSEAMIYLPFIGIMPVDVDDIVGAAVNVLYHVDSYTGSCIAQITVAKENYSNTLYQFSGNCSVEVPLAGGSQAQIKASLMTGNAYQNAANISAKASLAGGIGSGLTSLAGGALSQVGGNPIGLGLGAASGIGSVIGGFSSYASQKAYGSASHTASMLSGKAIVQHSGSFGASHGAMGIKKPYIIIRRPIQKVVSGYQKLYGYPAHKQVIIGECTGFLRCREVHVVSSLATDHEKSLIEQLLVSGVYVTEE